MIHTSPFQVETRGYSYTGLWGQEAFGCWWLLRFEPTLPLLIFPHKFSQDVIPQAVIQGRFP